MNNQEIYDKVSKHLLTQNKKSKLDGKCSYRGDNHTSCAIGCLIPYDLYDSQMEGGTIWGDNDKSRIVRQTLVLAGVLPDSAENLLPCRRVDVFLVAIAPLAHMLDLLVKLPG